MKAKGKTCPAGKGPIFGCLPRAWLMRRKDLGSDMVFFEGAGEAEEAEGAGGAGEAAGAGEAGEAEGAEGEDEKLDI